MKQNQKVINKIKLTILSIPENQKLIREVVGTFLSNINISDDVISEIQCSYNFPY